MYTGDMDISTIRDEDMVATMIAQHGALRTGVKDMAALEGDAAVHAEKLFTDMVDLRKTLEEHLALENDVFYPRMLKKMEEKHFDAKNTIAFIEEMQVIGVKVFGFFNTYGSIEAITKNPQEYVAELNAISSALEMRMSAEEDGVYLNWNL
jgi:hypothetical protein